MTDQPSAPADQLFSVMLGAVLEHSRLNGDTIALDGENLLEAIAKLAGCVITMSPPGLQPQTLDRVIAMVYATIKHMQAHPDDHPLLSTMEVVPTPRAGKPQ